MKSSFFIGTSVALLLAGISLAPAPALAVPKVTPPEASTAQTLATVDGVAITDADIEPLIKNELMKINIELYEIRKDAVDFVIEKKLLDKAAKAKGLTVDQLLKKEVFDKLKPVTDDDVKAFYEMHKQQAQGKPFEEVKEQIRGRLMGQLRQDARSQYIKTLKTTSKVSYVIKAPRLEVSVDDDPGKGNPKAPIQLIEFSEFQCPYCKKARPIIKQVLETYKDKIYYVFRDFPLSFHKYAKRMAHAANCAKEQGKYWEFNEAMWDHMGDFSAITAQAGKDKLTDDAVIKLADAKLVEIAGTLKLDADKLSACQVSGKFMKEIDKDIADGQAAGVSGTPAYFINGKFMSGAQPFEKFKSMIDEELE